MTTSSDDIAELPGRGKDRLLAVRLSGKRHERDREWAAIGCGPWDAARRESWVDLDRVLRALRVLRVHENGMRRQACALDRPRFDRVVQRLRVRYGWS